MPIIKEVPVDIVKTVEVEVIKTIEVPIEVVKEIVHIKEVEKVIEVKLPPKTCAEVLAAIATEAMGKLNGRLKHVFPDWAGCKMALKTPLDYKGAKAGVATSGGVAFKVEIASVRTHLGWRAMACVLRATPSFEKVDAFRPHRVLQDPAAQDGPRRL